MTDFINQLIQDTASFAKVITLSRNDFLIKEGQIEHHLYLVQSGALRIFFLSETEENTIRLGYRGSIINSLNSFLTGNPSEFYIQAIRKSQLTMIPKTVFKEFIGKDPERLINYNRLLEQLISQQIEREIDILTHSPIERYQRVLKRSPQLFQEIPAKYIASYLRMTPETLSRIRNS